MFKYSTIARSRRSLICLFPSRLHCTCFKDKNWNIYFTIIFLLRISPMASKIFFSFLGNFGPVYESGDHNFFFNFFFFWFSAANIWMVWFVDDIIFFRMKYMGMNMKLLKPILFLLIISIKFSIYYQNIQHTSTLKISKIKKHK